MTLTYEVDDKLLYVEGLGFDTVTGEAVCCWFAEDEDSNVIKPLQLLKTVKTGFFFETVHQLLPVIAPDGTVVYRQNTLVAPWNFPKMETVKKLTDIIKSRGFNVVGIAYDDENAAFPLTHKSPQVIVDLGFNCKVSAGQLLRNFIAHIDQFGRQDFSVIDVEMEARKHQQS